VVDKIFYNIIAGIYSNVAKIYDILIGLVEQPDQYFMTLSLGTILDVVYVMAGVFMLFRVMVAMIQYFVNPDQISDNSSGTGKLITRVVVSVVLLILLQPTGIILGDSGLLKDIERAVLADDGIITRIIESDSSVVKNKYSSNQNNGKNAFIEDVYADSKVYSCYYYSVKGDSTNDATQNGVIIDNFYRIDFSTSKTNNGKTFTKVANSNDWYYYSYGSNVRVGGENGYTSKSNGKPLTYTKLSNVKIRTIGKKSYHYGKDSSFSVCPKAILPSYDGAMTPKFPANKQPSSNAHVGEMSSKTYPDVFLSNGIYGGTTSVHSMMNSAQKFFESRNDSPFTYFRTTAAELETPEEREEIQSFLNELEYADRSLAFAQTMAGTFIDCSGNEECDDAKGEMFVSNQGNNEMVGFITDEKAVFDWFTGAIVGIALIIYLLILCIDILVRRLKLIFMEVLSPIPVVSYVDPKDKMFNTWFKMYISIYVDLFIKLIAMALLINLLDFDNLQALWDKDSKLLVKFFYIVAILVFAKLVPSMLTKVLGIESNGGSFKDIVGMAKGAAGFGAGAAIGGAVGIGGMAAAMGSAWKNTPNDKFRSKLKNSLMAGGMGAGTALSSTVRGAAAGSKGKILEGAKGAYGAAGSRLGKFREGFTPTDMLAAATLGKAGMTYAQRQDKAMLADNMKYERLGDVGKIKDSMKDKAKGSKFAATIANAKQNGLNITGVQEDKLYDAWIESQISGDRRMLYGINPDGTINEEVNNIWNSLAEQGFNYNSSDVIEGGKQAGIMKDLNKIQSMQAGDKTISGVIGNSDDTPIRTFADVDAATKKANAARDTIEKSQDKIKESSEYRVSKASLESGNGKKS